MNENGKEVTAASQNILPRLFHMSQKSSGFSTANIAARYDQTKIKMGYNYHSNFKSGNVFKSLVYSNDRSNNLTPNNPETHIQLSNWH